MAKFKGDEFKFPDEQEVKAPDDSKIEFEIEGEEAPKEKVKVEKKAEEAPEIEIVDDTPARDRGRKPLDREVVDPTDEELDEYSHSVRTRIKELTHARHDERRSKEAVLREKQELERIAQSMIEENKRLQEYVQSGEKAYAEKVQALAQNELERAKAKFKSAYDAGDADSLAAAQEEMTLASLKLQKAQEFRPTPLQTPKDVVQSVQTVPSNPAPADTATENWVARNRWFEAPGFEDMTSLAYGLHRKLVASGVLPSSDEYFAQIDAGMRKRFPEQFKQEIAEDSPHTEARKPNNVVAPATRSTSATKIRLTQTQVALAKRLGVPLEIYAKQVAKQENLNG